MYCSNCGQNNPDEASFCADCGAAMSAVAEPSQQALPTETGVTAAAAVVYAGFWLRFGARIIDFILLLILQFILVVAGVYLGGLSSVIILWVIPFVYFWLFTGLKGQTPGKMAVGIKVVDARGNVPGLGPAGIREIPGKIISTLFLFLGFFWVIWDPNKQGWHDKLAGTFVVKARRGEQRYGVR